MWLRSLSFVHPCQLMWSRVRQSIMWLGSCPCVLGQIMWSRGPLISLCDMGHVHVHYCSATVIEFMSMHPWSACDQGSITRLMWYGSCSCPLWVHVHASLVSLWSRFHYSAGMIWVMFMFIVDRCYWSKKIFLHPSFCVMGFCPSCSVAFLLRVKMFCWFDGVCLVKI